MTQANHDALERRSANRQSLFTRLSQAGTIATGAGAVIAGLYLGQEILIPFTLALMFNFLLSPIVLAARRIGMPAPVSAAGIILLLLVALAMMIVLGSEPIANGLDRLPTLSERLEREFSALQASLASLQGLLRETLALGLVDGSGGTADKVQVDSSDPTEQILSVLQSFGLQALILIVLLYFFLASGNALKSWIFRFMPSRHHQQQTEHFLQTIRSDVSVYLGTITLINAALGLTIATGLWLVGLDNPWIWGLIAGLLNFLPYLGFLIGVAGVGLAALLQFDSATLLTLSVAAYMVPNMLEANFITPSLLGKRFFLSPILVFLSVIFWSALWGVAGAFLAAPLLVMGVQATMQLGRQQRLKDN